MASHEGNEGNRRRETLVTLGERIRELRLSKGMTQEEFAKGIVTPSMISQIENGVALPSYMTIAQLAKRLGTTVDELYQGLTFKKLQMSAYKHALSQMAVGSFTPAMVILEDLIGEESLHYEISPEELKLNLAICYRETKRFQDASSLLTELEREFTQASGEADFSRYMLVNVLVESSQTFWRMGRYFEALRSAINAKEAYAQQNNPDPFLHGKILIHLADVHKRLNRLDEAEACYQEALMVYDQLSDNLQHAGLIYQSLAEVYAQQNNAEMTIQYADKAIMTLQTAGLVAEYREAKRLLIVQQVDDENWQDSIAVLLHLAAIYDRHDSLRQADLYLDIAEIYLRFCDSDESFNYCLKALSLLGQKQGERIGRANLILGRVYEQKGESEKAVHALNSAVNLFKTHGQLRDLDRAAHLLCTVLRRLGEQDKAWELFEDAHSFIIEHLTQKGVAL